MAYWISLSVVQAAQATEIASFFCGVAIAVVWPQDQSNIKEEKAVMSDERNHG
jgi:hypothetical protein